MYKLCYINKNPFRIIDYTNLLLKNKYAIFVQSTDCTIITNM